MSDEFGHRRMRRNPREVLRRKPATFQEAPGEAEAEAVLDAFLQRAGVAPAALSSALARADSATASRAISRLQQERGNAYVQRVLVQRAEVETPPALEGNPIVGLNYGDGLVYGTWDLRPRVTALQERLNEKMNAALATDGMFGDKAGKALRDFKESIGAPVDAPKHEHVDKLTGDALMGKKTQPEPPGKQPPGTQPTVIDQQLEDTLDAIWLQYQITLKRQNDALNRLEKDLSNLEKGESTFVEDLLATLAGEVFKALYPVGSGLLSGLIQKGLAEMKMSKEDQDFVMESGVKPAFDKISEYGQGAVKSKVSELKKDNTPPLDAFIESQRAAATDASADAQEQFLLQTKAAIRCRPDGAELATKLLKSAKSEKDAAFERQYNMALDKWAQYQAQTTMRRVKSETASTQEENVYGTDMSKGEEGVPGVLEFEIEGTTPQVPVKIKSATIKGLSEKTRKKLEERYINSLGLPVLAMGDVSGGSIKIAQNETGDFFECGSDDEGKEWLRLKAAFKKGENPDATPVADEKHGVREVFDEMGAGPRKLSQVESGLQGP